MSKEKERDPSKKDNLVMVSRCDCGSHDVSLCNLSYRFHCNECGNWPPPHWNKPEYAVEQWNAWVKGETQQKDSCEELQVYTIKEHGELVMTDKEKINTTKLRKILINRIVFVSSINDGDLSNLTVRQLDTIGDLLTDSLVEYYN